MAVKQVAVVAYYVCCVDGLVVVTDLYQIYVESTFCIHCTDANTLVV